MKVAEQQGGELKPLCIYLNEGDRTTRGLIKATVHIPK